jgi:hypothetical protein
MRFSLRFGAGIDSSLGFRYVAFGVVDAVSTAGARRASNDGDGGAAAASGESDTARAQATPAATSDFMKCLEER